MLTLNDGPELVPDSIRWIKSSYSLGIGECVEVALAADRIVVRNSRDPAGPVLLCTNETWDNFLASVRKC